MFDVTTTQRSHYSTFLGLKTKEYDSMRTNNRAVFIDRYVMNPRQGSEIVPAAPQLRKPEIRNVAGACMTYEVKSKNK